MKVFNFLMLVTLYATGMMGTRMIIPLVSNELGASTAQVGLIVTFYSILPLLLSIRIGKFIDKKNFRIPIVIGIISAGIGLLLPFIVQNIYSIVMSQLISGVSHTIFALAAQRYAGLAFGHNQQNKGIAQFSLGMALGNFLGPIISGLFSDIFNYYMAFGLLGILSLSSILLIFSLRKDKVVTYTKEEESYNSSAFSLLQSKYLRSAILMSVIVLFAKEIFIAYFPLYANEIGYSSSTIGFIISVHTVAAIIIRFFMGYLLKRFSQEVLVFFLIIFSIVNLLIIPLIDNVVLITLLSFLLGLGLGLGQPLSIAVTIYALADEKVGEGLGLRITFNRLTQVIAPVTLGGIATVFGMKGIFWGTGITMLIMQLLKSINDKIEL